MNLPDGVTQREITAAHCMDDGRTVNWEECFLCHLQIEQDPDSRRWFDASLPWKPTWRSDWLDSFETQQGWCCSTTCFNDHAVEAEESSTRIHLVWRPA